MPVEVSKGVRRRKDEEKVGELSVYLEDPRNRNGGRLLALIYTRGGPLVWSSFEF